MIEVESEEQVINQKMDPESTGVFEPSYDVVVEDEGGPKIRSLNRRRVFAIVGSFVALGFVFMAFNMFGGKETDKAADQDEEFVMLSDSAVDKLSKMERNADSKDRPDDKKSELERGAPTKLDEAEAMQTRLEVKLAEQEDADDEEEEDEINPWETAQKEANQRRAQNYYQDVVSAPNSAVFAHAQVVKDRPDEDDKNKSATGDYDVDRERQLIQDELDRIYVDGAQSAPGQEQRVGQRDKLAFHESTHERPERSFERLDSPVSPYVVQAGTMLPMVLETGISSELPGFVKARFSSPVYDSVEGNYLLIPAGTTVVGEYNSEVQFGEERVQIAWTRMILPNGKSMKLGGITAVDLAGQSGVADTVDNHWGKVLAAATLSSVFSAGAAVAAGPTSKIESDPKTDALGGFAEDVSKRGTDVVERQLDVPPTIRIRPGFQLAAFVREDLVLEPWRGDANEW